MPASSVSSRLSSAAGNSRVRSIVSPSWRSRLGGTRCFKFLFRLTSVGTWLSYTTFQGSGRALRFKYDGSRVTSPRVRHDVPPHRDELRATVPAPRPISDLRGARRRGGGDRDGGRSEPEQQLALRQRG